MPHVKILVDGRVHTGKRANGAAETFARGDVVNLPEPVARDLVAKGLVESTKGPGKADPPKDDA